MPSYTLPELIEMMKPQHQRDQALIRKCITGLTLCAAQHAQTDPGSPRVAELRDLIEDLACYWGFEDIGPDILQKDFR